jgi:hypothetical protein
MSYDERDGRDFTEQEEAELRAIAEFEMEANQ